jgi:CubicO group peptidase (beta-lactamase class C family)
MTRLVARSLARPLRLTALLLALVGAGASSLVGQTYWPGRHLDWERRRPEELGMDAAKVRAALELAGASEVDAPRDLAVNHQRTFGREPHGEPIGPFTTRGPQSGLIVYKGYIVGEWGEPWRVDNTFSVAKSFLSTTVGLAYDRGLIANVHDPVRPYMAPVLLEDGDGEPGDENGLRLKLLFESEHNRRITWDHLLRQTSDWEGTLWGKPEWADRPDRDPSTWGTRARVEPGTVYEYNDVRVNVLALLTTNVWRRPLPEVLREHVMDPIGASPTWRWVGYENSWITVDGQPVQSVSGGSHWGGGMLINAFDQARFGLLTLHRGMWNGRRIISEEWLAMATTPGDVNPSYGFMNFFLNTGRRQDPAAPESSWRHSGAGPNVVFVDPEHELVVVSRWGRADGQVIQTVLESLGARVASTQAALPGTAAQVPVTNRTSFAVTSDRTGLEVEVEISGVSPAEAPVLRIEGESRQVGTGVVAATPFTIVIEAGAPYRMSLSSDAGDFQVENPSGRRGTGKRFDISRQLCVNQRDTCMMYLANQWMAAR